MICGVRSAMLLCTFILTYLTNITSVGVITVGRTVHLATEAD